MNNDPLQEVEDILLKHAETGLTETERARLNTLLAEHPAARKLFARDRLLDAALHLERASGLDGMVGLAQGAEPNKSPKPRRYRLEHGGIAALLMIAFSLTTLSWKKEHAEGNWGKAIARIERVSEDVRFGKDHQLPQKVGSRLGKGWVHLERGLIKIVFRSGAIMEVEGPAVLGIDTPLRAYLDFGRVKVYAPEAARDFIVATESMEVVDLGTRFEVGVDRQSRESKVSVTEGLVDLHLGSRGTDRTIRPLEAGYAAYVDASGRIIEISSGADVNPRFEEEVPHILAHWTFDERAAGGIMKDSTAAHLNGRLLPGKSANFVPGVMGQSMTFDRDTSLDLREHISVLGKLDAFTFTAWVRDPGKPLAIIFSLSGSSEQHRVQFYLSNRHLRFGWQDGLHYDAIYGAVDGWEPGQWYHVAVTAHAGAVRLYRDGEMLASGSKGFNIGTPVSNPSLVKGASHAYIGRLVDGRQGQETVPQSFEGLLDDVQLYAGALNQEAIQFIFEHPGQIWSPESKESHDKTNALKKTTERNPIESGR